MDFLTYLQDYEQEDVTEVAKIVESNKKKEAAVIQEAFNTEYPSKKEALFNITNTFLMEDTVPDTVDSEYVKENLKGLIEKVESMNEGDIRIIIHNHENKKEPSVGFEEENKPKGKRGRPKGKKQDFTKAPKNTGVIYDEAQPEDNDPSAEPDILNDENENSSDLSFSSEEEAWAYVWDNGNSLPDADDKISIDRKDGKYYIVYDGEIIDSNFDANGAHEPDVLADEDVVADVEASIADKGNVDDGKEKTIVDEVEPEKVKWSDIVKKVSKKEKAEKEHPVESAKTKDELVEELRELNLSEEDLEKATEIAESGEIIEGLPGAVGKGAELIKQIGDLIANA